MNRLAFICVMAFAATQGAVAHISDVLDDLMPVPAMIKRTGGTIDVSVLQKVKVERATVSDAPVATADEAYVLEIGSDGVTIRASSPRGERWARVTLDQLMRLARVCGVPCCRITDWPRLKWRGFMLDSVRNYLPPKGIKDVIDMMSRYKLNLFHWHFTENYAWRLESKLFPELQSERAFLHRHKGKFYTQEEFKDIVDYAYSHGVCVMPEFDFPGHALAFRRAFGFKTMSDPGVAEKGAALFAELCSLAPKEKMPFIHMGTDEVFKRDVEGAPRETLELMAKAIADGGRTMVSWVPGENYDSKGPRINMLWTDKVSPDSNPGAYFDAIGMYIEDYDPFELLSVAVYHKAARWHDAGDKNQGAIFCAWHDGFVGLPYENLLRNQPVFPSCVLFGNAYWRGRDVDHPEFRKCLPYARNPLLADAIDIERRVIAQRDRVLCDIRHPFHFLRQTDMRWRMSAADGTVLATDIAQATVSPARFKDASGKAFAVSNDVVVLETWIKSPQSRTIGAWIGFINLSRDHGFVYSAPMPEIGEWNRFGATAELNGEKIAPPNWKCPGLKKGSPIPDWTPAWTLYEADEEPFTDQEYYMREPTRIQLRKGWNHVKLVVPNPMLRGNKRHRWSATFIPVEGPTDHPREVPGLEYSSTPPVVPCDVKVRGHVGKRMNSCIENHLLKHDAIYLTDPYKDKTEDHYWQCEFWGKWMHSAAPFLMKLRMDNAECRIADELQANISASVENLLSCQEECGYLGNYAPSARCGVASKTKYGGWDVWCQKYTLLGLLYADECLYDKRCLDAACRHLDWLMTQVGPSKKDIGQTGRYHGLASLSTLEPVVWLYRRTGKKEYLDFASYIVSRMDAEEGGGGLVSKALAGVDVADRTSGKDEWEKFACSKKAYEMLSCYQGLLEYYKIVKFCKHESAQYTVPPAEDILKAVVLTAKNVIAAELNIVGGAASQELWYHGKGKQTHPYYRMNETCVITTWMRLCESLLAVTGDPSWADELERTFYNIYLATLSRDGSTFAQYTGLEGTRSAGLNNCFMEENCCNANGPRGFVSFLRTLVTADKNTAMINLYETSTASVEIPALKEKVTFETFTLYPKENSVRIVNRTTKPLDFTLKLRIPAWSAKTEVKVNGKVAEGVVAGKYFELKRRWVQGDKVEISFDMPCRVHLLNNHVAFTRGPVVLARDARFRDGNLVERMRAIDFGKEVELRPVPTDNGDIWMAFAAYLPMGAHSESPDNVHPQIVRFCDFASAGNTWTDESAYRVWLPVELRPWDTPMDSPEVLP